MRHVNCYKCQCTSSTNKDILYIYKELELNDIHFQTHSICSEAI